MNLPSMSAFERFGFPQPAAAAERGGAPLVAERSEGPDHGVKSRFGEHKTAGLSGLVCAQSGFFCGPYTATLVKD
jgi:hypothetical protein